MDEILSIKRIDRNCMNCTFCYDDVGDRCCSLIANGFEDDPAAFEWIQHNTDTRTGRLLAVVTDCPRFIPYPTLLLNRWIAANGGLSKVQKDWLLRGYPTRKSRLASRIKGEST